MLRIYSWRRKAQTRRRPSQCSRHLGERSGSHPSGRLGPDGGQLPTLVTTDRLVRGLVQGEGEPFDLAQTGLVTSSITQIELTLRTIGAIAVIAGTILVVLQLRVNAKNVRSRNAFDLIAKVIDPSFPHRRHLLYAVAEKHAGGDWIGFDRSLEDFEVRNFANIYEQLGLLARKGVVDLQDVLAALSAQPMADWDMSSREERTSWTRRAKPFPRWRTTSLG